MHWVSLVFDLLKHAGVEIGLHQMDYWYIANVMHFIFAPFYLSYLLLVVARNETCTDTKFHVY